MKTLPIIALIFAAAVGTAGCAREKKDNDRAESSALYHRTCTLTEQYIDSLKQAKDSTEVNRLLDVYEERIDELNFDVAPDTDYKLSEGENDTIAMLMDRLAATRAERLKTLDAKAHQTLDSLKSE